MRSTWKIASLGLVLPLLACGDSEGLVTVEGSQGLLAGGEVRTWAVLDHRDDPVEVGLTIPLETIQKVGKEASITLDLPVAVKDQIFFKQVVLDYKPHGNAPAPAGVPHFDIHFYGIDGNVRSSIDCSNEVIPSPAALPSDYVGPSAKVGPGGTCEVGRGVQALGLDLFSSNGAAAAFSGTVAVGYHRGQLAFLEPVLSRAHMLMYKSFELEVPYVPGTEITYWPTTFRASYDDATKAYRLRLSGFQDLLDQTTDGD
jgi:hypothetical protein